MSTTSKLATSKQKPRRGTTGLESKPRRKLASLESKPCPKIAGLEAKARRGAASAEPKSRRSTASPPKGPRQPTGQAKPAARLASARKARPKGGRPPAGTRGNSNSPSSGSGGSRASLLDRAETLTRRLAALILIAVVAFTLIDTTRTLARSIATSSVPSTAMIVVNGVIFGVILIEIIRTVLPRFEQGPQLQRLLLVAIVCVVRDVLSIGAHLALSNMATPTAQTSLLELGINTIVVVGLVVAFVLMRRYGSTLGEQEPVNKVALESDAC